MTELRLFSSIDEIGPWRPTSPFLDRAYLRALEQSLVRPSMRYATLAVGGQVVAGAVVQILDLEAASDLPALRSDAQRSQVPRWLRPLARRTLDALRLRLVMAGNAFVAGAEHGWWDACITEPRFTEFVRDAVTLVATESSQSGVRVVEIIKDIPTTSFEGLAQGHRQLTGDPPMSLTLSPSWRHMDDYVAALRSKYRRQLRSARERFAGIERRRLCGDEVRRLAPAIEVQYQAVLSRARAVPVRKTVELWARLADELPAFSFVGYFAADELIAFNTRFQCRASFESHLFGMDYPWNERLGTYRNILYDDIADAIAMGSREVRFGRACQEIKSAMGAWPMPLATYYRTRSRTLDRLLAHQCRSLEPDEWSPRRAFRELRP